MINTETPAGLRKFGWTLWSWVGNVVGGALMVSVTAAFIGMLFYTVIGAVLAIVMAVLITRFNRPRGSALVMSVVGIAFMVISDILFLATAMTSENLGALGISILIFSGGVFLWHQNTFRRWIL